MPESTASARGRNTNAKPLTAVTSDGETTQVVAADSNVTEINTSMREPVGDSSTATAPQKNVASVPSVSDAETGMSILQQHTHNDNAENVSRTYDDGVLARSTELTDGPHAQSAAEEVPTPQSHTQLQTDDTQNNTRQDLPSTTDTLQVEAHAYPWLYMNSTLEACFPDAEKTAKKELDDFETQQEADETQASDEKLPHEAKQLIEFCEELAPDAFSKEAPAIMQSFISHGERCSKVEEEALQLTTTMPSLESEEPLKVYNEMLSDLDALHEQAMELEKAILRLTGPVTSDTHPNAPVQEQTLQENGDGEDAKSARAQVVGVFAACLPVLRARMANISMAQELIDSAQENFSLALRMEDMGID